MGHGRRVLLFALLAAGTGALAAEVRSREQVRCIERDQHIPAHPAPGETRVHLRFVSGSQAGEPARRGWAIDLYRVRPVRQAYRHGL
jgi:hypothetical protein